MPVGAVELSRYTLRMQLADWLFTLLLLRSDDPHGRSAVDVTATERPGPTPAPTARPRPVTNP